MRHKIEDRKLNEEKTKETLKENKLRKMIRLNWMIFLNCELLVKKLNTIISQNRDKAKEIIKKEVFATRIQKMWKFYKVFFLFLNLFSIKKKFLFFLLKN